MHSHPLSIPHTLVRPRREPAEAFPPEGNFVRGLFFGVLFSAPVWAVIIWGIYELAH